MPLHRTNWTQRVCPAPALIEADAGQGPRSIPTYFRHVG